MTRVPDGRRGTALYGDLPGCGGNLLIFFGLTISAPLSSRTSRLPSSLTRSLSPRIHQWIRKRLHLCCHQMS